MRRLPGWRAAALLAVALPGSALGAAAATAAERGVSAERVLFGQSAAFSGPAGELGRNMRLGIEAAFAEVNARKVAFTAAGSTLSRSTTPTNRKPRLPIPPSWRKRPESLP